MIGTKISPILNEIEDTLWEFEAYSGNKTEYTIEGFRSGCKIFMSVLMDKMWELQEKENIPMEERENMVHRAGSEMREIIKKYTDIDTHDLYK